MRSIDKIRRRNVHVSSVCHRVSILSLSLSLTFSTNLLIARALARFTNTVEDDARLAPGEKDRGNRARDKFSFMHSRLVS